MRQLLAHYRKQPREVLNYQVDYRPWLQPGEDISSSEVSVLPVTDPALDLSNTYSVETGIVGFIVSAGTSGQTYQVTILTTTTNGQVVEREIYYTVEEL